MISELKNLNKPFPAREENVSREPLPAPLPTLTQALQARYQNSALGPKPAAVSSMANLNLDTFEEVISASIIEMYDTLVPLRTITIPEMR